VTLIKRKTLALTLILALLFSAVAGTLFVNLGTADPIWSADFPREPDKTPPAIILRSPFQNQTFNSTNIPLNFTVAKPETWFKESSNHELTWILGNITSVSYEVDGGEKQSLPVHDTSTYITAFTLPRTLNFSLSLTLPEGTHNITVGVEAESYYVPPGYLTGPPFSVTVHEESELVSFTVVQPEHVQPEPETEPFPVVPLAVSVSTIALVCVGLLVYFKKRKHQAEFH
jgi:hypothetical protein